MFLSIFHFILMEDVVYTLFLQSVKALITIQYIKIIFGKKIKLSQSHQSKNFKSMKIFKNHHKRKLYKTKKLFNI